MHTIVENICFLYENTINPARSKVFRLVRNIAIMLIVSLLAEVFIFNINYFSTLSNTPVDMNDKIEISRGFQSSSAESEAYRLTSENKTIEFHDINCDVNSLFVNFPTTQNAQSLQLKIQYTDEAHLTYFDTTEYTTGIPNVTVSTSSEATQYIKLKSTGKMQNLKIEVVADGSHDLQFPLFLDTIVINPNRPFNFLPLRFFALFSILLLIYAFRPKSAIYNIKIRQSDIASKAGIIASTTIEIALACAFLFYGSNLVGVATNFYNYGDWDGKSIVNSYEVGGDNAQQYADLARAIAHGQVYLEDEPPQWLKDMDTPYDKGARDEAQKETGESYLFDVAFFNGHYYVYFGVVPVFIFYLPFYLLTGANFPTAIGVLIATIAFIVGITALLHRFAKYHFKQINLGVFILCQVAVVCCSGVLYLLKFPTFYSLPIACSLALCVWGIYFWMRGRSSRNRCLNFLVGSLCMALIFGCRPQLVLLSFLAFPLFWKTYIKEKRLLSREGACEFACLVAPYVAVVGLLLFYNYIRFGSLFDFGANYNLTVHDMTKRGLSLGRIAPALFSFFFQTANITGVFPYLQSVNFDTTFVGQTVREVTFGGIFACLPILWTLLFSRSAIKLRNAQRKSRTTTGVIMTLIISGFFIAILDAEVAGILQRYYSDFSLMFLASAILIVFIFAENVESQSSLAQANIVPATTLDSIQTLQLRLSDKLFNKVIIVLVTISVVYSVLVCFVPETGWYSDIYPMFYQELVKSVQFWT